MNDIFISYANADRAVAQKLADALEALGWSVWWDREIPFGKPFDQVIEDELNAARCVIVLWSKESVRSRWVKTEAGAAADRDRLMPVLIEDVPIPLELIHSRLRPDSESTSASSGTARTWSRSAGPSLTVTALKSSTPVCTKNPARSFCGVAALTR